MPGSQLNVRLYRDSFDTPWGFRLQGGKDLNQPLTVQRVFSNSPAEGELQRGDVILAIGGEATSNLSHKQAQDAIKHAGGQIILVVNRPPPGCVHISPLSPPIVTQRPRAPSLQDISPSGGVPSEDRSPSNRSPQRPNTIHTPPHPSYNHSNYQNSHSHSHHSNMSIARRHNVPIHVHIEPQRPHQAPQTSYYQYTPSPTSQYPRNDPYGTMPRRQRGFSQPPFQSPTTPTIPPPPWATQQAAPKKVSKLSTLGGGGDLIGTSFKSSTLPRRSSYQPMAQQPIRRPEPNRDEVDAPDLFQEKRPTGPPPKVCNLSTLGGGAINFASGIQESQTLPRRNITRRLSQPPNMPSRAPHGYQQPPRMGGPQFASDYGRPHVTPAQRYEPDKPNGVMLNRVQSSLDNITLSPRTPDPNETGYFSRPPQQQPQPTFYTPTSLLLENQKMEEERQRQLRMQQQQQQQQQQYQRQQQQQRPPPQPQYQPPPPQAIQQQSQFAPQNDAEEGEEEEEPIVPVWERRKKFQDAPVKPAAAVRTPRGHTVPKVQRPAPGKSSYTDFGLSYRPQQQQSNAVWQPSSAPRPAPPAQPQPQIIQIKPAPAKPAPVQSPVKPSPASWQRPQGIEDETDGTPAWRNTLRSTGVKLWDMDLSYTPDQQEQEPQRSVPFNPTPYQTMYSAKPQGDDAADGGPKIVHLQYNSPMGLYSNENVAETYRGQTLGMKGQQQAAPQNQADQQDQGQGQGLPGGRDWSQSQVFRFIQQDVPKKPKGKPGPATAPKPQQKKPQYQAAPPPPQQHQHQAYGNEIGISDF